MSCVDSVVTCCRCPRNVKRLGWDTWMRRRSAAWKLKRLEGGTAKSKSIPCRPIQTPETCPAFSCPSISCPSYSCPSISCLDICMSVNFMPGLLVRQFHVRQFHAWTFRWPVIFMSVIFSAPTRGFHATQRKTKHRFCPCLFGRCVA